MCTDHALHAPRVNEATQVHTELGICCKFEGDDDTKQGPLLSHDWACVLPVYSES